MEAEVHKVGPRFQLVIYTVSEWKSSQFPSNFKKKTGNVENVELKAIRQKRGERRKRQ